MLSRETKNVQTSFDRLFAKDLRFFFAKLAIRFLMSKVFQKAKFYQNLTLEVGQNQCFGSGSGSVWIRIIWSDPDPDPYQETIDMDPGSVKN